MTKRVKLEPVSRILKAAWPGTIKPRVPGGPVFGTASIAEACMYAPLTEEQAIHHGLEIANEPAETTRHAALRLVLGSRVPADFGYVLDDAAARAEFVSDLARLSGPHDGREEVRKRLGRVYGLGADPSLVTFPFGSWWRLQDGRTEHRVIHRVIAPSLCRVLGYVLLLLLDDARAEGARLRRCQLEECSKFFLQKKPERGQAGFKYCTTEHQRQADRLKSAERVAAKRAGLSVAEWRKRK